MVSASTTKHGTFSIKGIHTTLDSIAWDDYRIPAAFWKRLKEDTAPPVQGTTPCWRFSGAKDTNPQVAMATRLMSVNKNDLLAVVPTCGRPNCARPDHLCVTLRRA